jgi:ABC-2 type transport system ATP-binding protein
MLQLTNIKKSFGTHLIFSINQLTIPKGIHWLKGANGAGKSTLLKIMAGELPFEGEILMNNSLSIQKNPTAYRLLLNHAEAEPIYPSFLTGMDILAFVSDVKKGNPEQIKQVRETLSIDNYLENPIGTYSSGMLKKLSLLLAFTGQPDWILLDEPLTTLDIDSQKNLCKLIMQRHRQGVSFIITSHHDIAHSDIDYNKTYLLEKQQIQELTSVS